jgi:GNAT superfamily N-acetyltransferase
MAFFKIRKGLRKDCSSVMALIKELAFYEKAEHEVSLTVEQLEKDGFGDNRIYDLFVAEDDSGIIGIALFYEKYSTWKGRCIYLEDLIVTESKRGIGAGKALFEAVMDEARKRGSMRMEWQVLDWNQPAIEFYKKYDATLDPEWINGRFKYEDLQKKP